MKKIIVTGGLGFIGSNLSDFLLKKKYKVLNIDKANYASNLYNIKKFRKHKNYKFIKNDLSDSKKIYKIINGYKPVCIFHLAAETHVDRSIDSPKNFIKSNIVATFNLLEAFRKYSNKNKISKLIHVSTDEVYGDVLNGRSLENNSYMPSSPYAASKASSDHLVFSYIKTYKIPAIITNCSNNYGPNQYPEKLIPLTILNALEGKDIPIYGNGEQIRDWLYVDDHADALYQILQKGKIGETYNIGGNNEITNIELVKKICLILDEKIKVKPSKIKSFVELISFVQDRPGHDFRYGIDASKLKNELYWEPTTSLDLGLLKTVDWYINNQTFKSTLI